MGWFSVGVNKIEEKHIYRRIGNKIKERGSDKDIKKVVRQRRVIWY